MKKKIVIFTEGGSKNGLGHLARCSAIYEALLEAGQQVTFVVHGDDAAREFLSTFSVRYENWMEDISIYVSEDSYVIVDSYLVSKEVLTSLSKLSKRVLYIDDVNRLEYPKGMVLNFAIFAPNIPYPQSANLEYLLGMDYAVLRSSFRTNSKRTLEQDVKDILIIMGGADVCNVSPVAMQVVGALEQNVHVHVIVGSAFDNKEEIKALTSKAGKTVSVYENIDAKSLRELMLSCDFAISAAGQTTYELMACKLPFLAVQVIDNQEKNVQGLLEMGMIQEYVILDKEESFDQKFNKIQEKLAPLLAYESREDITKNMSSCHLEQGIQRMLERFLEEKDR